MSPARVVLDTNVLVSAVLTPGGPCDKILQAAVEGRIRIAWTPAILAEYREVLSRPKFGLSPETVRSLLDSFDPADRVSPAPCPALPDPDDEAFLAAALASGRRILITGNAAHFPRRLCRPAKILTPAEALFTLGLVS